VLNPVLISYHYLRKSKPLCCVFDEMRKRNVTELMVDSGAFSAKHIGAEIDLNTYNDFAQRCEDTGPVWNWVMLDVIGDSDQTLKNLDITVSRGLQPMPVLTADMSLDRAKDLCDINRSMCVAGGTDRYPGWKPTLMRRYWDAYEATDRKGLLHGLGFVNYPESFQCPLTSCDSTAFINGQRFGSVHTYNASRGWGSAYQWSEVVKKGSAGLPIELAEFVKRCGVRDFSDRQYIMAPGKDKGGSGGAFNTLSCTWAYMMTAQAARRHGLLIFLAASNAVPLVSMAVLSKLGATDGSFFPYEECQKEVARLSSALKRDAKSGAVALVDCMEEGCARISNRHLASRGVPPVATSLRPSRVLGYQPQASVPHSR
tara:strand:- start:30544 stop:31656 length:1113 start_codon:yes stop_codon:yes gene_type:complete